MTDANDKSFWTSLPGILAGIATILTSVTGLVIAFKGGEHSPPAPLKAATAVMSAEPTAAGPSAATVVLASAAMPVPQDETTAGNDSNDPYVLTAVIEDKDGFSNVRAGRSAKSELLAVVKKDEPFSTYRQDTQWWRVKTQAGVVGYMHASRIRLAQ